MVSCRTVRRVDGRTAQALRLLCRLQCERCFHLHSVAQYAHFEAGHGDLRIFRTLASLEVKAPPMPGTFEQFSIERAFAQWSSRMGTSVIDRSKRSVDIAESEEDALNFNRSASSRRDLVYMGYGDIQRQ